MDFIYPITVTYLFMIYVYMRCWKDPYYLLYVLFIKEILIVWDIVINNSVPDRDPIEVWFTT